MEMAVIIEKCIRKKDEFPDYIQLEINEKFIQEIDELVKSYKDDVKEAVVYHYKEMKNVSSDKRISYKTSFQDQKIKDLLQERLVQIIEDVLNRNYTDFQYLVNIAPQSFDYICYKYGGYFEKHKDFIRIDNQFTQQYSLLLGLTNANTKYIGGHTILWSEVDETVKTDYDIITSSNDYSTLYNLFQKHKIPFYNKENLFEIQKEIKECNLFPTFFNTLIKGQGLLFKSNIIHAGQKYVSFEQLKELLMLTLTVTALPKNKEEENKIESFLNSKNKIIMFNDFESWMPKICKKENLIPFQVLIAHGDYNDKHFENYYTTYWNFDEDLFSAKSDCLLSSMEERLQKIYKNTKTKLNIRHREYHILSKVLKRETKEENIENFNISFKIKKLDITDKHLQQIDHFVKNNIDLKSSDKIIHTEEVKNRWEESGCNDDGDIYDDTTYLHCKVKILFGFCKV